MAPMLVMWCRRLTAIAFFFTPSLANEAVMSYPPDVIEMHVSGLSGEYNVRLYVPKVDGLRPVIFFVGGFAGDVSCRLYGDLLTRIAARGYIIAGIDRLHFPNYLQDGLGFQHVLKWAVDGNMSKYMAQEGLSATPDLDKIAVMGQSEGNHVIGQAMAYGCTHAKAFVMIDPVDGVDPYRIIKSEDLITPGQKLNFTMPGLILDNGLDEVPAIRGSPPCVPLGMGTTRYMGAWRGPIWNVNATKYGHVDCLNEPATPIGGWVCRSDSSTDKVAYRRMLADTATNFLEALFQDAPDKFALLEDTSYFSIEVTVKHDLKGLSHEQIKPGCTNNAQPIVV